MSYRVWLEYLKSAEKVSIIKCYKDDKIRQKVLYKFPNGLQMAEEYCLESSMIQRRAWMKCIDSSGQPVWEVELGDVPPQEVTPSDDSDSEISAGVSKLTKSITPRNIEWCISNLPNPFEKYRVTAEPKEGTIIVRSENNKYRRVIPVPELVRCDLPVEQQHIFTNQEYNKLTIYYRKPLLVCELEAEVIKMLRSLIIENEERITSYLLLSQY